MFVSLSVSLSCLYVCLSVCLSVCLFVCLLTFSGIIAVVVVVVMGVELVVASTEVLQRLLLMVRMLSLLQTVLLLAPSPHPHCRSCHCTTCITIGATRGVMVNRSAFLACHQCYCAGSSLAWGLNLWTSVCGIFWSSSPGVFSRYSGFLPSFIG